MDDSNHARATSVIVVTKPRAERSLAYPPESAGSAMGRFQAVRDDVTCGAALAAVRGSTLPPDELRTVFVIDARRNHVGDTTIRDLTLAHALTPVSSVTRSAVAVRADEPKAAATRLLGASRAATVAVTDEAGRLIGAIRANADVRTVDDSRPDR